jgi:uncharacterized integral membrane protein (TIGR00697 family)
MNGRHLWVRTIGSSLIGYVFDTVPFVLIAFLGVLNARDMILMVVSQYLMKIGIEAFFGTPLAYAAVRYLRRAEKGERQGYDVAEELF